MVKLVDTSDKLQPAILVRKAVFERFRNMLPLSSGPVAPEETGHYTRRSCYPSATSARNPLSPVLNILRHAFTQPVYVQRLFAFRYPASA